MRLLLNSLSLLILYPRFLEAQMVELPGTVFINPAPSSSLATFQLGSQVDVRWSTNLSSFSIFLWAQYSGNNSPNSDSTPLFTQQAGEVEQTSFAFDVSRGPFTTTGASITFFLSIGPDDNISNGESATSGYFDIVDHAVENALVFSTNSAITSSSVITSSTTTTTSLAIASIASTYISSISSSSLTTFVISPSAVNRVSTSSTISLISTSQPASTLRSTISTIFTTSASTSLSKTVSTSLSSSQATASPSSSSSTSSTSSIHSTELKLSLGLGIPLLILFIALLFSKTLKGLGTKLVPILAPSFGSRKIWGLCIFTRGKGKASEMSVKHESVEIRIIGIFETKQGEVFEMSAEKEPIELRVKAVDVRRKMDNR